MALGKISDLAKRALEEATSKKTLTELSVQLVDKVKKRTRLGRGVKKNEGDSHPLPKLKEKTVQVRDYLKRKGKLTGPGATPGKSGVNRTGDTLESLKSTVTENKIELKLSPSGTKVAKELEGLSDEFTFMNLSKAEVKFAVSFIQNAINKVLKGQ